MGAPGRPLLLGHRGSKFYAAENSVLGFTKSLEHGCDGFEFDLRLARNTAVVCCHDGEWQGRALRDHSPQELSLATIEEALAFSSRAFLDIELKECGIIAAARPLFCALDPRRCIVTSFSVDALQEAKQLVPALPRGLICDNSDALAELDLIYVNCVVLHHSLATREIADWLHGMSKRLYVWTVNDADEMRRFARMRVDAIISDDTKLLAQTVTGAAAAP